MRTTLGVCLEVGVNQIQFLKICIYSVFDDLCLLLEIVSNLHFNLINYLSFIVVEVKVLFTREVIRNSWLIIE